MKLKQIYNQILKEDIYGRYATVFHRTNVRDLINHVYTSGFKPGSGDMYGKGFYSTYSLESQLRDNMANTYGNIIVKFQVNIDNFLIFDYDEFIKSPLGRKLKYNNENFIFKQLDYFKLNYNKEKLENKIKESSYSSDIALNCYRYISDLNKKVDGLIFTGRRDGNVLVCYRPKQLILPMSYSDNDGETWTKTEPNLDYLKNIFKNRRDELVISGIEELRDNLTLEIVKEKFPWLLDVIIEDAIIGQDSEGKLVWYDGTWENGTWKDGTWEYGTWLKGTWEDGTWKKGTWWNGTWLKGTWKMGVWEDGTWKDGTWERGIWWEGIWENGTWKDGTWKYGGVWKKGTWENGTWWNGTWEDGHWIKGIWENGTWKGGTWYNGTWKGGTWENGTWKDETNKRPDLR